MIICKPNDYNNGYSLIAIIIVNIILSQRWWLQEIKFNYSRPITPNELWNINMPIVIELLLILVLVMLIKLHYY